MASLDAVVRSSGVWSISWMAWLDVLSRSLAWTGTGPAFPFQPGREVPDGPCRPIPGLIPAAAAAHDCWSGWRAVPGQEHQSRDRDRGRAAGVGRRSRVQFVKFGARCGTAGGQAKDQPWNRPRASRTAATWKPRPEPGQVVGRTSQVYRDPGIPVRSVQRPPVGPVTLHPRQRTAPGGVTPSPAFLPR